MGAERAVVSRMASLQLLTKFNDKTFAKVELHGEGDGGEHWILMATITLHSTDGDPQPVTARLVHDNNVVIVDSRAVINDGSICLHLQAPFTARHREVVTLEANTYDGFGHHGSLIALKVDQIDYQ